MAQRGRPRKLREDTVETMLQTEQVVKTESGGISRVPIDGFDMSKLDVIKPYREDELLPRCEYKMNHKGIRKTTKKGESRYYFSGREGNKLIEVHMAASGKKTNLVRLFKPHIRRIDGQIMQYLKNKKGVPTILI